MFLVVVCCVWAKHGWKVKTSGITTSDLQAGVVVNHKPYNALLQTGVAGHTAVVKSVSGSNIVIIEQNYAGRQYCLQNTYNINSYLGTLQSICIPPELVAGSTVEGKTTTVSNKATTETYTTTETVYEEVTETETFYIDEKTYKEWKNDDGVVEFYLKNSCLYAPLSREDYPSVLSGTETNDNWIRKDMTVESDSEEVLISTALRELKKNAYPSIEYEVDGYIDVDIGDTVRIDDDGFAPKLLLQARVSEQHISFSNPTNNKTIFSNFKALENKTSSDLISRMNQLFEESKPYQIRLETDNGVAFKNHEGQTTLTPTLLRGGKEYECQWNYAIDDIVLGSGANFTITAEMVPQTTVLTVSALINGVVVASEQVSFINADDGDDFDINSPEVQEFREQINETLDVRANQALEDAKDYANAKSTEAREALDRVARTLDEKREALEAKIREALKQADDEFESEKLENLKRESEMANSLSSEFTSEYNSISSAVARHKSEAESLANRLNNSLNSEMSSELLKVANSLKSEDSLITSKYNSLSNALRSMSASTSNLARSASTLQSQVTSEKTRLNSTASELVKQANSQSQLTTRVTTLTSNYNSTKTVTSELSKSLTSMNGSLTAVTNRTKTVEDGLSSLRTSYNQTTATVSALTGKVDTTTERVATIETGLNGVNERFEKLRVGTRNLLRNTANLPVGERSINKKLSGNWVLASGGNGTGSIKAFNDYTYSGTQFTIAPQAGITHYARVENNTSGNKDWCQTIDSIKFNTDYTLSFWVRRQGTGTVNMLVRCWNDAEDFKLNEAVTSTAWVRKSVTFKFKKRYNNSIQFGMSASDATAAIDFCGMQLEEGNIPSDWHPSEEDYNQALAEYKRDSEQNLSALSKTVETVDGKVAQNTTLINQTASGIQTRLTSLETYKNDESKRANQYFESAKTETARQITAERTAIAQNYVAKNTYTEDAKGTSRTLSETTKTMTSLSTSIGTATTRASEALVKANSASTTATNAKTTATTAANTANNAQTTANTAKSTADSAKTTADAAKKTAETVTTNLANYQQTNDKAVSDIRQTVQTTTSDVSTLKTSVANVTQTANSLKTEITTVEAKIPTFLGGTNLLLDSDQPSINPVYAKNARYFSDAASTASAKKSIEARTDLPISGIKYAVKTEVSQVVANVATNLCFYSGDGLEFIDGETYTMSCWAKGSVNGMKIRHQIGTGKYGSKQDTITTKWKRYSWTFTYDKNEMTTTGTFSRVYLGGAVLSKIGTVWTTGFKLEIGSVATDWSPNPTEGMQEIESAKTTFTQKANSIEATVSSLNSSTVKSSQLIINSNGIVMTSGASDTNFTNAIANKLSLNQNAVDIIAPKIKVSGNMIVNGSIQTQHISTNAIQTQHIQSSAINADKIATDAITADKIKARAITGAKIEVGTIETSHIKAGTIEGSRIKSGTITGNLIAAGTIVANNIAAGAIDTGKISTVGLSADVIKGGTITAKNGETTIGLNDGLISFTSNFTGIRRVQDGAAIMGLRFNNHNTTVKGQSRIVSRIWLGGERREGSFTENWGKGGFTGIVTETIKGTISPDDERSDRVTIVGDRIRLVHSFDDDPNTLPVHGWQFETYRKNSTDPEKVVLRPYGSSLDNWSSSIIYSGDIKLCNSKGTKGSLREVLNELKKGFQYIVNGGTSTNALNGLRNVINEINARL